MTPERPDIKAALKSDRSDAFTALCVDYLDGRLDDVEAGELKRQLEADSAKRQAFVLLMYRTQLLTEANRAADKPPVASTPRTQPVAPDQSRTFRVAPILYTLAALLAIAAYSAVVYFHNADPTPHAPDPQTPPAPSVATLIESTGSPVVYEDGIAHEGGEYARGTYSIASGSAQFVMRSRVTVDLRGKTQLRMYNPSSVYLARGEAAFKVPTGVEGFTVHLPDESKIVDLGTAFRVEVDDEGQTKLRVTEGQVEWTPAPAKPTAENPAGATAEPVLIAVGQTARIIEGRVEVFAEPLFTVDFEDTISPGDDGTITAADGTFTKTGWPNTGFTISQGSANTLRPASASAWLNPVPQDLGETFGVLHAGASATADVDKAFSANTTYTLTFTQFRRDDLAGAAVTAMILTADGTELTRDTFPAITAKGAVETRKLVYTTSADGPEIGRNIQLRFVVTTGGGIQQQVGIDNISLDAIAPVLDSEHSDRPASPQTPTDNRQRVGDKP